MQLHLMKTSDAEPLSGTVGSIIIVSNVTYCSGPQQFCFSLHAIKN